MVEDLSPELLEIVGQAFDYPHLEVFAEHILGSRYKKDSSPAVKSSDWNTCNLKKPFTSITWYRPVYIQAGEYGIDVSKDLREIISTGSRAPLSEVEDDPIGDDAVRFLPRSIYGPVPQRIRHRPRSVTNIFRRSIQLSVVPDPPTKSEVPYIWEEKATLFVSKRGKHTNGKRTISHCVFPIRFQFHCQPWLRVIL
jgi:hypothetical protein